jgi:AmiR/NasT family two-component response regulator
MRVPRGFLRELRNAQMLRCVDDGSSREHTARVSQAAGIVSVQAGCSPTEALGIMQDRALIEHVTLWALARGVIEHVIQFN